MAVLPTLAEPITTTRYFFCLWTPPSSEVSGNPHAADPLACLRSLHFLTPGWTASALGELGGAFSEVESLLVPRVKDVFWKESYKDVFWKESYKDVFWKKSYKDVFWKEG